VTPIQRHTDQDKGVLINRKAVFSKVKKEKPERWSGNIRNWDYVEEVYLNPEKVVIKKEEIKVA